MKKIQIACLPVAGLDNPYQQLMMGGLNASESLYAFNGVDDRFFGIIRTALRYRPDYLHFDWIVSYYYRRWKWLTILSIPVFVFQIWFVKNLLGTRIVWTMHNLYPHDIGQQGLHQFCQKLMVRNCEWVRVFGKETAQKASQELHIAITKIHILPEGDYTNTYPNKVSKQQARSFLNIPLDIKVILNIGFIKPYKGIEELIKAFKNLQYSPKMLLIVGRIKDQEYAKAIFNELPSGVRVVPEFIPPEILQNYFNAADVVVLPFSKIENSGSVIMAMGFSKPIIAPNSGAVAERLENQTDLLFNDQLELAEKLNYALNLSEGELEAIGLKNRAALKKYDWPHFQNLFV